MLAFPRVGQQYMYNGVDKNRVLLLIGNLLSSYI